MVTLPAEFQGFRAAPYPAGVPVAKHDGTCALCPEPLDLAALCRLGGASANDRNLVALLDARGNVRFAWAHEACKLRHAGDIFVHTREAMRRARCVRCGGPLLTGEPVWNADKTDYTRELGHGNDAIGIVCQDGEHGWLDCWAEPMPESMNTYHMGAA